MDRELVLDAAVARGLNAPAFLDAVRAREVGPLAARPLTLNMLLNEATTEAGLPDSQIELYNRALLHLAQEPGEQRAGDPQIGPAVDPRARLAIAERIAAATILSGRTRISPNIMEIPTSDTVTVSELAGGQEVDRGATLGVTVAVTDDALGEVLGSALFSARGSDLGWAHQTYGEHLAASYLTRPGMPLATVLALLGSRDAELRVVPQLRDVAAAAAAMNRALFDELASRDPLVLLRGDLRNTDDTQKRTLVDALLDPDLVLEVPISDPRTQRAFGMLAYDGIEQDVRSRILDSNAMPALRQLACRLIEFCGLSDLAEDLLALALDSDADLYTRVLATHALRDNAGVETLRKLVPLARDPLEEDEDDDLKAAALEAICPAVVPVAQVFDLLTPRKADSYFGGYASFLNFEMPRLLDDQSGVLAGLGWVRSLPPHDNPTDAFSPVAELVLARSFEHLDQPGFAAALAQAIASYFADGHSFRQFRGELTLDALSDTVRRHALLDALIEPLRGRRVIYGSLLLINPELAFTGDILWMLEQLATTSRPEDQAVWVALICQLARDPEADHAAIWDAREQNSMLDEAVAVIYEPIDLNSELAEILRESHDRQQEREPQDEGGVAVVTVSREELVSLLDRFEAGDDTFIQITAALWSDAKHRSLWAATGDFSTSPGWRAADPDIRARIAAAAQAHLDSYEAPDSWQRAGALYNWQIAGYSALLYLHAHEPQRLQQINESRLPQWIEAALTAANAGEREAERDARAELMRYLKSRAPAAFARAVTERLLAEAAHADGHVYVVRRVQPLLDRELGEAVFDIWKTTQLGTHAFDDILHVLIDSGVHPTHEEAVSLLTPEFIAADPGRARSLATALITAKIGGIWEPFCGLWDTHPDWAKEVFLDIAVRDARGSDLRLDLADSQLAELFVWLSDAFPRNTDPESRGVHTVTPRRAIAHYRDHILTILTDRGTLSSIAAMDQMAAATGQSFPYARITAQENRRTRGWTPPSPREIIHLASDPRLRLLQSNEDLHQLLVTEALPRIQQKLRDEGQAHDIWDTHARRPKQETEITDWIAHRLRDDLQTRGIIINREVEIRVAPRGVGERTDIQVDAIANGASGASDQLSVTIEVKGCWHPELMTAMSAQLADRYLSDDHPVGIYLVAWFNGDRWTQQDRRRVACGRRDLEATREQLTQQASGLQSAGYRVTPVIVDCAWSE